ncbi:MAG TPA: amidohydrolase family protein [Candidatus Binatia bacterium]|nr:amidohydrolase family protein [Candidatus Binatia bacterium]
MAGPGPYALAGRVVTMAPGGQPLANGVVYVKDDSIVAVLDAGAGPPPGFENVAPIDTKGTIYPGLIELHNHLSYDALPLWDVPQKFSNRDKWSSGAMSDTYRKLISGPMQIVGTTPGLPEAVVRYVEVKCLLGGTTTSQGIALYSDAGIRKLYFGACRNVEVTKDKALPIAATRIPDVAARDIEKFFKREQASTSLILHLAEGTDQAAESHFTALQRADKSWAIAASLAGIHCVALTRADFDVLASKGASMVWSPLSNLLLYGATADVASARAAGVRMGIGSDWSPSGSKNLLFELRVARAYAKTIGGIPDRDLLAMATIDAAGILGWDKALGSLEAGKRADILVVARRTHDPYEHLFQCTEADVELVVIDGVARAGTAALMTQLGRGTPTETVSVGTETRVLDLEQSGVDPTIAGLSLADATTRLRDALADLPQLAKPKFGAALGEPRLTLELDHDDMTDFTIRPELPDSGGFLTGLLPMGGGPMTPLEDLLEPIDLDPLTVVDDGDYLTTLAGEINLVGHSTALAKAIGALD